MSPLNNSSPINTFFQGSSPHDSFLSKLCTLTICSEDATLKTNKPLPLLERKEASTFHAWIHQNFFVTNKQFKIPYPVSTYSIVLNTCQEMVYCFQQTPLNIVLNGGAPPFFFPLSYLKRFFHLLGILNPEDFLTEDILRHLQTHPNDFDIKIDASPLNKEQFEKITGSFNRYLNYVSAIDETIIQKRAYTKNKLISTDSNEFFIAGIQGPFNLDLVISRVMERTKLFSHEFNLQLNHLFFYNAISIPVVDGSCQALIYRLSKVLHIEDVDSVNEYGWARVISYFSKGWRSFQEDAVKKLYEKSKTANLSTLLKSTYSSHHKGPEEALALLFNTKVFSDFQEKTLFDTSPIPSPLGSKIRELLQTVPFNTLKSFLFFKCFIQWTLNEKAHSHTIETTLNFKHPIIQFFLTPDCCLALPYNPLTIEKEQMDLLNAPQHVIQKLFELDPLFSPITSELKRKAYFKGLEEDYVTRFMKALHIMHNSESLFKKENASFIAEFILKKANLLISDGKKALKTKIPSHLEQTLLQTLEIFPTLQKKWELHEEMSELYIQASLSLLERSYSLRHTTDVKIYANYDDYLNTSKELVTIFETQLIALLNKQLHNLSFSDIPSFTKTKNLESMIHVVNTLIKWAKDDLYSKPLIMAIIWKYLSHLSENAPSYGTILGKLSQEFFFISPKKTSNAYQIHFEGASQLLYLIREKKYFSAHDHAKLCLFFNSEIISPLQKESQRIVAIDELTNTIIKQDSAPHIIHLWELLKGSKVLFKKYPQQIVDIYRKIFTCSQEKHGTYIIRFIPLFDYFYNDLFEDSDSIGFFSCQTKAECGFAKELFLSLFNATLSLYKTQLKNKLSNTSDQNIPKFLCKMLVEGLNRKLFDKTETSERLKELTNSIKKCEDFKEDIEKVKSLL